MKTYKDGLLEAAKVCDNYVESYIHSAMAIEIRALAAQEDQPQEQSADDLLRECRAMLDGLEAQPLIYRIDKAMGGDMTPERAAEILDQATNKGEQLKAQIVKAILQSCAEQREADAKIAEGYELPGKLVAAAIRGQT